MIILKLNYLNICYFSPLLITPKTFHDFMFLSKKIFAFLSVLEIAVIILIMLLLNIAAFIVNEILIIFKKETG